MCLLNQPCHPCLVKLTGYNSIMQVSQSTLSFVAVAEATPIVSALTSLRIQPRGLIIVGPEGGKCASHIKLICIVIYLLCNLLETLVTA